jgi:hypothetical protein
MSGNNPYTQIYVEHFKFHFHYPRPLILKTLFLIKKLNSTPKGVKEQTDTQIKVDKFKCSFMEPTKQTQILDVGGQKMFLLDYSLWPAFSPCFSRAIFSVVQKQQFRVQPRQSSNNIVRDSYSFHPLIGRRI